MLADIDDVPAMGRKETIDALYDRGDSSGDEDADDEYRKGENSEDEVIDALEGAGDDDGEGAEDAIAASGGRPHMAERRDILITGDSRRTRPLMSIFEHAALIGERATHIEQGATNIDDRVVNTFKTLGVTRALDIAEIEMGALGAPLPLDLHRRIAPGVYEVWGARELKTPKQVLCESYSDEATALLSRRNGGECERDHTHTLRAFIKTFQAPRPLMG